MDINARRFNSICDGLLTGLLPLRITVYPADGVEGVRAIAADEQNKVIKWTHHYDCHKTAWYLECHIEDDKAFSLHREKYISNQ